MGWMMVAGKPELKSRVEEMVVVVAWKPELKSPVEEAAAAVVEQMCPKLEYQTRPPNLPTYRKQLVYKPDQAPSPTLRGPLLCQSIVDQ